MGALLSHQSPAWFDHLPVEVIFEIFDYLSNNDIIYTFFDFSTRFNSLLLDHRRYLNYFELPTRKFQKWEKIFSIIGPQVQTINITTIDFSFPFKYFSNLKSIIISSRYGLPEAQFQRIFVSEHFIHLHSFKIKEKKSFSVELNNMRPGTLVEKIFNDQSSLQIFQYPFTIRILSQTYQMNYNLRSLKLILLAFHDIFNLISYTPNLEYLHLYAPLFRPSRVRPIKKIDVKLKQLHLVLRRDGYDVLHGGSFNWIDQLISVLQQFSLSLTCLSLHLLEILGFYHELHHQLQQVLQSMVELKQFHLYAKFFRLGTSIEEILSRFKDSRWSFGMHGEYFYTLPFYFDYLYGFSNSFDDVKSNYPQILLTNPRIWHKVESIELCKSQKFNTHFLHQLKTKMPKLTLIKFIKGHSYRNSNTDINNYERETNDVTLNNVTTIEYLTTYDIYEHRWFLSKLPNLKHLIIFSEPLSPAENGSISSFYLTMQQSGINNYYPFKQLTKMNYSYFSNIQSIYLLIFSSGSDSVLWYADVLTKILKNYQNLQTLVIHNYMKYNGITSYNATNSMQELVNALAVEKLKRNYQMTHFDQWLIFSKHEHTNDKTSNSLFSTIWKKLSFWS